MEEVRSLRTEKVLTAQNTAPSLFQVSILGISTRFTDSSEVRSTDENHKDDSKEEQTPYQEYLSSTSLKCTLQLTCKHCELKFSSALALTSLTSLLSLLPSISRP